jgi:hypothetical protein
MYRPAFRAEADLRLTGYQ